LAVQALNSANIKHEVQGDSIHLTSGNLRNAVINLTTGTISGDTDHGHNEKTFGLLRQHYSEAKVRSEYLKTGATIEERTVDQEGNVVLQWAMQG
jgi:hypothetical protein